MRSPRQYEAAKNWRTNTRTNLEKWTTSFRWFQSAGQTFTAIPYKIARKFPYQKFPQRIARFIPSTWFQCRINSYIFRGSESWSFKTVQYNTMAFVDWIREFHTKFWEPDGELGSWTNMHTKTNRLISIERILCKHIPIQIQFKRLYYTLITKNFLTFSNVDLMEINEVSLFMSMVKCPYPVLPLFWIVRCHWLRVAFT